MAIEVPKKDDLQRIAKANDFELSDSEADAIGAMMKPIVAFLDRIDTTPIEPSASVTKYRERDAGRRPTGDEDPLNAVVRKISVKGAASGKLKGKRVAAKDSVAIAGIPICGGSHILEGYVPDNDATIVSRMLDEGAEIVATLVMDDFALSGDGTTSAHGHVHNPHRTEYCSGGSSCGSGAALAYDWIDITIGTDQGGSIRIPSSWSGVAGIKPTYGLVPYTGVMSIDPSLDHVGPMARNVSDLALTLEVIAGKDPEDYRQQEVRVQPYREALGKSIAGRKLAILKEGFTHPGAQDDVNAAVRKAAAQLQRLGATVEEVSIPEHREAWQFLWPIALQGMASLARTNLEGRHHGGRYDAALVEFFGAARRKLPVTRAITVKFMLAAGGYLEERYHGRLYAKAQNLRAGLRATYDSMLSKYDALVMPSTPMKPHRRDERAPYTMVTNTAPFDVTGHPGLSVPCGMSDGLPIGLMLIGRHFDDATLLQLGHAYEQSVDWRKA
ncbi:MAG TPA: amidase [Candidatus Binataceae bacterium]|nr:amidase [Candidatus Binataceae bacterium]